MGSIDTPPSGIKPYMGESEILEIISKWTKNDLISYVVRHHKGDPKTIAEIEKKSDLECKLILMGMVHGVETKTADEIKDLPREEMMYILLRNEAFLSQLRNKALDTKEEAAAEIGHEVELNEKRRIGIHAFIFAAEYEQTPVAMPDNASEDTKKLFALGLKNIGSNTPMDVRLKKAVEEKELSGKKAEDAEKKYNTKVEDIKANGERFLKAEKQKFDAAKAEIKKNFDDQKGKLTDELRAYETTLAEALINTLDPKDGDLEAKTAAIEKAGFVDNLLRVQELGKNLYERIALHKASIRTRLEEREAYRTTKAASQQKSDEYEAKQAEDGRKIEEQSATITELQDAKTRLEEIAKKHVELKETEVRLRATLTRTRIALGREQERTGLQEHSIEELSEANRAQEEFVAYAQEQIDNVENAVKAHSSAFKSYLRKTLAACALIAVASGILTYTFLTPYLRKFYAPRVQTAYVQGPERKVEVKVEVPGPERIVEVRVEVPGPERVVERVVYRDTPLADVPVEIEGYDPKSRRAYVKFGETFYYGSMQQISDIYKEIKQEELKLGKKSTPLERKIQFENHVNERKIK